MMTMKRMDKIRFIQERDGELCFLCDKPFNNVSEITFDHWIPRAAGGSDDIENLRITHKRCNVVKGDLIPNDDGTLPERPKSISWRDRKVNKERVLEQLCDVCLDGRKLSHGQTCGHCGSEPGPERFPRYLKRKSNDCDHSTYWCWACSIGIVERRSTILGLMIGEDE